MLNHKHVIIAESRRCVPAMTENLDQNYHPVMTGFLASNQNLMIAPLATLCTDIFIHFFLMIIIHVSDQSFFVLYSISYFNDDSNINKSMLNDSVPRKEHIPLHITLI